MFKLIYSNLVQRPTRTAVSILAVSLGVALILVSVGLSYGQLNDLAKRTRKMGDIMVQPSGASQFLALNSGTFDIRIGGVIQKVEGVEAVAPVLTKFLGDKFQMIFGIDEDSFSQVSRGLVLTAGTKMQKPRDLLVDTLYAETNGLAPGDHIELLGNDWVVSGIFEQGIGGRVLVPLQTLQEINGTPDKSTLFFVRAAAGTSVNELSERLKDRLKGYTITKTEDLQELMTSNTPVFRPFITAMVVISSMISFLMILLAMYTTITERTREIGILKSLGASRTFIVQLILEESLLICSLGVLLGFLFSSIALRSVLAAFPTLPVDISPYWRLGAALMAIGGGCVGALYPALKAARLDPIRALGYE